ncbi:hypothetical protein SAMN05216188_120104 [Lentzea xinjiangensis]|uniref:Leucine rich repeat variant domain-containing protein n=1 Tax=Lentzea xinjiangensis TaxID=402600 RepID=A0A1H9U6H7_9PSEU|nr:hypothetical protein [Lentzea xinjiangensis]SES04861.1 hypothetical protein SAMN05216188_120104 [Lentzea xinjiangensis]
MSSEAALARALASNPATPAPVAAGLMRHHSARHCLAARTDLPADLYEQLASEVEPGVLARLARNPAVPGHVLRRLTGTRALRQELLRTPALPLDLLADVAATAHPGRFPVPRIASATRAELRTLAESGTTPVRRLVAAHPGLPPDLVERFVADADPGVAGAVAPTPQVPADRLRELVPRHGPRLCPRVALNPSCPPELLHHMALCVSSSAETYRAIARHPGARGETLLLCLGDAQARHLAAAHPNLPVETILELLGSEFTAGPAAANPSLPVHVMEELVDRSGA